MSQAGIFNFFNNANAFPSLIFYIYFWRSQPEVLPSRPGWNEKKKNELYLNICRLSLCHNKLNKRATVQQRFFIR
jgi:hypothetical protein